MIDERTMDALRLGAALVHAVPGIGLDLDGDGTGIRVTPGPEPADLSPCAFRAAVVQAAEHRRRGRAVVLRGLSTGIPRISLRSRGQSRVLPGGIVLFRCGGEERVATATLLDPSDCTVALADDDDPAAPALRLHHDQALGVSILHAGGPETELDEALRIVLGALARCAAEELVAELRR